MFTRIAFVLAFSVLALISVVADFRLLTHPQHRLYGGGVLILIDVAGKYDSRIGDVRGQVAGGWLKGDRFSAASLPFEKRLRLYAYEEAPEGDALDVSALRAGRTVELWIPAVLYNVLSGFPTSSIVQLAVFDVLGLLALTIAGAIVLLRPGYMTWGLYFFVFGAAYPSWSTLFLPLPGLLNFSATNLGLVLQAAGYWGFVQFCARFPDGTLLHSGKSIVIIAGIAAAFEAIWYVARNSAGVLYPIASVPSFILSDNKNSLTHVLADIGFAGFFILGVIALALRYRTLDAPRRLKTRAVFITLTIYAAFNVVANSLLHFSPVHMLPTLLDQLVSWGSGVYLLIPITVLYAILHYRMFDVTFVVNRAFVYATLTAFLVFALAAIDFAVSRELSQSKLAFIVEAAVALAFAFSLERLKQFVERIARGAFFGARERALDELRRVCQAMQHATKPETVQSMLTREPLEILNLTSAAVFRGDTTPLHRIADAGWDAASPADLDADSRIVLEVRAHGEPVRINSVHANDVNLPVGEARPAVAIPLMDRHALIGLVFYGGHRNGSDIDPDELRGLHDLCESAAHAYDHIELTALKAEIASLRAQLTATTA